MKKFVLIILIGFVLSALDLLFINIDKHYKYSVNHNMLYLRIGPGQFDNSKGFENDYIKLLITY